MIHWKSPWCWERLRAEGEENIMGLDGWTGSWMSWTWTWASSWRWWGTGRPGMLQSMGSQRVEHDWATEQQKQQHFVSQGEIELDVWLQVILFMILRKVYVILLMHVSSTVPSLLLRLVGGVQTLTNYIFPKSTPQREFSFGLSPCLPSFILLSICDRSEKRNHFHFYLESIFIFFNSWICYYLVIKWCPTLQPHGLQHTRLPCPSVSPGVCSNSCPLSWWCHPTISSSVTPFSSCLHSFPASESLPMSQLFASCGQSIAASASVSVLSVMDIESFPLSN